MRNTCIEVTHNKKMRPRYLGLLVVISRNQGGAYILCKFDEDNVDIPNEEVLDSFDED